MTSPNERKYARLLRWYPRWWRDMHGPVVLATLIDIDDARGGTGPTSKEAWTLRSDGLQHRWSGPVRGRATRDEAATKARRSWARVTSIVSALSLLTLAIGGWYAAQNGHITGSGGDRTLEVLLRDASNYQRDILSDALVTTAEYEQALLDWRECVSTAGAQPSEVHATGDNQLTFDYDIIAPTDDARREIEVVAEACLPEYFNAVGTWWVEQPPQPLPQTPLASR